MMLINRSLPVAVLPLVVILMQITFISALPPPPPSFPAHRRTLGFVDHFIRANPLRALSNYLGRKLSLNVYYPPPPPPPRQQFQPQPQLQQIVYVPRGIPPPQSSHYVKLPVYLGQNVAMIPPVNPASQFNIVPQPNYQQVQQPPQLQQYFLHGISYPASAPAPSYNFIPQVQQHTFVQPAVSNYQPPVVTQATSVQQVQPQAPITYVPQTSILVDEQHKIQHDDTQYPYSLGSNIHTEYSPSPATQAVDNSFGTLPTLVNSASEINDNSPSLNPNASPNVQIDGFEDTSSAGDMLKIFVIRPKDMERLRSSTESERNELAKEYSMKYFDLEQGAQELGLDSSGEGRDQINTNNLRTQTDETCIEPLCDPFLQKLIPQLLQSTRNGKGDDDDPIVIVKNSSHITAFNEDPFLQNHKLVDLDVSQEPDNNDDDEPPFTIMKAVEGVEGHTTEEIFEGRYSTLKPKRVKVHFPRRKLLSAKISSAALRRKQTQSSRSAEEKSDETNSFTENFSRNESLIPKPRNLEIDEVTYPRYKYRTTRSRNLEKQRTVRAGDFNERKDNSEGETLIHYAGGVIFNNDSKVSK